MISEYDERCNDFYSARACTGSIRDYLKLEMTVSNCELCIGVIKNCIELIDEYHKEYATAIRNLIYSGDQIHAKTAKKISASFRAKLRPLQVRFELARGRIVAAQVLSCGRGGES